MTESHSGTEKKTDRQPGRRSRHRRDAPARQHDNGHRLETVELDHSLILRVQRLGNGATVHRFSQDLTVYIGNVELWNRFVAQGPATPREVKEKLILRDRALAMQVQLRQEIVKEELRSIHMRGDHI